MNSDILEKFRKPHPLGIPHAKGDDFGWFEIPSPIKKGEILFCMSSGRNTKPGWYHVSVSCIRRCPTWPEMCHVKELFFDETETVVQYHPAKSEYVNNAKYCLHLWKYERGEFPKPDSILVGIK